MIEKMPIPPKKSLGQNFLVDKSVVSRIIEAAGVGPEDFVVEIGPGTGVMTRELAKKAGRVLAIELDERLIRDLREEFAYSDNVEILHEDALKFDFKSLGEKAKVIANLPYYISTPMVSRLIAARENVSQMVLMLQKEVAERITAPPGGKEYGYLSVMVQLYVEARTLFTVPPGAFLPVPKVESAVVLLRVLDEPAVACRDYTLFEKVVSAAFSQRRKTLRNTLKASRLVPPESIETAGEKAGIDLTRRGETLSLAEFARLTDNLAEFI